MKTLLAIAAASFMTVAVGLAKDTPRQLGWDDLQPEGEEEILDRMYRDFYEDLDRRRAAAVSPLSGIDAVDGMGNGPAGLGAGGFEEGGAFDAMPQIGTFNTVDALDGEVVEIPGFIVPLDGTAQDLKTFLLVPYFGACIHTPPPPPNQIVYVTTEGDLPPVDIWSPVWAMGTLSTARSDTDLGNAAYTLELSRLREYDY